MESSSLVKEWSSPAQRTVVGEQKGPSERAETYRVAREEQDVRILTPSFKTTGLSSSAISPGSHTTKITTSKTGDYKVEERQDHYKLHIIDPKVSSHSYIPAATLPTTYRKRYKTPDFPSAHSKRSFLKLEPLEQRRLRSVEMRPVTTGSYLTESLERHRAMVASPLKDALKVAEKDVLKPWEKPDRPGYKAGEDITIKSDFQSLSGEDGEDGGAVTVAIYDPHSIPLIQRFRPRPRQQLQHQTVLAPRPRSFHGDESSFRDHPHHYSYPDRSRRVSPENQDDSEEEGIRPPSYTPPPPPPVTTYPSPGSRLESGSSLSRQDTQQQQHSQSQSQSQIITTSNHSNNKRSVSYSSSTGGVGGGAGAVVQPRERAATATTTSIMRYNGGGSQTSLVAGPGGPQETSSDIFYSRRTTTTADETSADNRMMNGSGGLNHNGRRTLSHQNLSIAAGPPPPPQPTGQNAVNQGGLMNKNVYSSSSVIVSNGGGRNLQLQQSDNSIGQFTQLTVPPELDPTVVENDPMESNADARYGGAVEYISSSVRDLREHFDNAAAAEALAAAAAAWTPTSAAVMEEWEPVSNVLANHHDNNSATPAARAIDANRGSSAAAPPVSAAATGSKSHLQLHQQQQNQLHTSRNHQSQQQQFSSTANNTSTGTSNSEAQYQQQRYHREISSSTGSFHYINSSSSKSVGGKLGHLSDAEKQAMVRKNLDNLRIMKAAEMEVSLNDHQQNGHQQNGHQQNGHHNDYHSNNNNRQFEGSINYQQYHSMTFNNKNNRQYSNNNIKSNGQSPQITPPSNYRQHHRQYNNNNNNNINNDNQHHQMNGHKNRQHHHHHSQGDVRQAVVSTTATTRYDNSFEESQQQQQQQLRKEDNEHREWQLLKEEQLRLERMRLEQKEAELRYVREHQEQKLDYERQERLRRLRQQEEEANRLAQQLKTNVPAPPRMDPYVAEPNPNSQQGPPTSWRRTYTVEEQNMEDMERNTITKSEELLERERYQIDLLARRDQFIEKPKPPPEIQRVGKVWEPPPDKPYTFPGRDPHKEWIQNDDKSHLWEPYVLEPEYKYEKKSFTPEPSPPPRRRSMRKTGPLPPTLPQPGHIPHPADREQIPVPVQIPPAGNMMTTPNINNYQQQQHQGGPLSQNHDGNLDVRVRVIPPNHQRPASAMSNGSSMMYGSEPNLAGRRGAPPPPPQMSAGGGGPGGMIMLNNEPTPRHPSTLTEQRPPSVSVRNRVNVFEGANQYNQLLAEQDNNMMIRTAVSEYDLSRTVDVNDTSSTTATEQHNQQQEDISASTMELRTSSFSEAHHQQKNISSSRKYYSKKGLPVVSSTPKRNEELDELSRLRQELIDRARGRDKDYHGRPPEIHKETVQHAPIVKSSPVTTTVSSSTNYQQQTTSSSNNDLATESVATWQFSNQSFSPRSLVSVNGHKEDPGLLRVRTDLSPINQRSAGVQASTQQQEITTTTTTNNANTNQWPMQAVLVPINTNIVNNGTAALASSPSTVTHERREEKILERYHSLPHLEEERKPKSIMKRKEFEDAAAGQMIMHSAAQPMTQQIQQVEETRRTEEIERRIQRKEKKEKRHHKKGSSSRHHHHSSSGGGYRNQQYEDSRGHAAAAAIEQQHGTGNPWTTPIGVVKTYAEAGTEIDGSDVLLVETREPVPLLITPKSPARPNKQDSGTSMMANMSPKKKASTASQAELPMPAPIVIPYTVPYGQAYGYTGGMSDERYHRQTTTKRQQDNQQQQSNVNGQQHRRHGSLSDSLRRRDATYLPNGDIRMSSRRDGGGGGGRVHKSRSSRDVYHHHQDGDSSQQQALYAGPIVEFPPTLPRGKAQQPPPGYGGSVYNDYNNSFHRSSGGGGGHHQHNHQHHNHQHHHHQQNSHHGGGHHSHQNSQSLKKSRSFADWERDNPRDMTMARWEDSYVSELERDFRDSLMMPLPDQGSHVNEREFREEPVPGGGQESLLKQVNAHSGRKYDPHNPNNVTNYSEAKQEYHYKKESDGDSRRR